MLQIGTINSTAYYSRHALTEGREARVQGLGLSIYGEGGGGQQVEQEAGDEVTCRGGCEEEGGGGGRTCRMAEFKSVLESSKPSFNGRESDE